MTVEAAISCEGLVVRYGRAVALDRVSFKVPTGATVALLGRNGAGKSSAIRCLLGQQRPDGGRVRVLGRDVWRDRTQLMNRVGVVPEEPDLPPEMTARQLAQLCRRLYGRWNEAAVATRLQRFGVPDDVPSGRLSKGQKAQLGLALALGHGPELLVLDDPTLGLDAIARKSFFEEVIDTLSTGGVTVLITTHDLAGVERIADRVVLLHGAKVVLDDDLETIRAAFRRLPDGSASLEAVFTAVVEHGDTGALPPGLETP
jgi:ABC-2 type transport system ATP-binding protein